MAKIFDRCPPEVENRVADIVRRHHADLAMAEVTFDLFFVSRNDDDDSAKPVLTLHGVACLAIARIASLKERAKGCRDAEILIDRDRYDGLPDAKKDALLDHELHHFMLRRDEDGGVKTDDLHRPRLRLRPHDYDFGWFQVIAERHGTAALEVQQARLLYDTAGHAFFPFLNDLASPSKP